MTEFTDCLEDCMPTIPKRDPEDKLIAKLVEGHQASPFPPKLQGTTEEQAEMFPRMANAMERSVKAASTHIPVGSDMVNLPAHYARFKIEPIRFLVENYGPCILAGKVIKYTMRYDAKNGMEDLQKAMRCLIMLQKYTAGDPDWWTR